MAENLTRNARELARTAGYKMDNDRYQRTWSNELFKAKPSAGFKPQHPANVLVWKEAPQYKAMIDKAFDADQSQWFLDPDGRGIHVPLHWLA